MTTMPDSNPTGHADSVHIPMSELFLLIGEQADVVVRTALQHRHAASEGARSALNTAIDRADIAIDGFRKPSRAQPDLLASPVLLELLRGNDRLASTILRTWAESLPDLAKVVTDHLQANGIRIAPAKKDSFDAVWPENLCFIESGVLVGEHPEFNRHDAELMLCYISGRFPVEVPVQSDLFERFLRELNALPSDATEWDEAPNFLTELTSTIGAKLGERQRALLQAFDEAISDVASRFADELRYLEVDLTTISSDAAESRSITPALTFAEDLLSALESYREVHPQAPTKTEETQRVERRDACESRILSIVDSWHETIGSAPEDAATADEEPGAVPATFLTKDDATEHATDETAAENARLKSANDALHEDRATLRAENARLTKELASLEHAHDNLRTEKEAQGEENSLLKRQLRESRLREEAWRGAPVTADLAEDEAPPRSSVESVREAIAAAAADFPDQLFIALNSRSKDDTPFRRPDEVFNALSWLATVYHRARTDGNGDTPDFDRMLKEVCPGWSYIPHQSAVTIGKFKDWYYTSINGTKYELAEHVGRGSSGNPQYTIRIAFAWDDHAKRVVVGYVGHHQRSQGS